jgi:uncharacterized membrane protein YkvA (DUF1232 family)
MDTTRFERFYSSTGFWKKMAGRGRSIGRGALEKALYLYFAAQSPDTPKWARRVIIGALGYFVLPLDAIPDLAPMLGFTDDVGVMAAALATVAMYITPNVKMQAHQKLDDWFGPQPSNAKADA